MNVRGLKKRWSEIESRPGAWCSERKDWRGRTISGDTEQRAGAGGWIAEAPPALCAGPVLDRPLRRVSILFEGSTLLRWGLPMPPEDSSCLLAVYHSYGRTTI